MIALIDGDVLLHRACFSKGLGAFENSPDEMKLTYMFETIKSVIDDLLKLEPILDYKFYLSCDGQTNFRYKLATIKPYKGNRRSEKPPLFYELKQKLITELPNCYVSVMCEADDDMGCEQTKNFNPFQSIESEQKTCIVTIDKDLNMIPGMHLNLDTFIDYYVSEETALRIFYTQLITGDTVDNIQGIPKKGKKAAEKALFGLEEECDLYDAVKALYVAHYDYLSEEEVDLIIYENANLLWIRRKPGVYWKPPVNF